MQSSAFSSPVISTIAGKRQLTVQSRKALQGLDLETGDQLWSIEVPAFRGMNILTPLVNNDTVFTSAYGGGTFLFDVAAGNGSLKATEQWKTAQQGYMSSPVMIDGDVYLHLRNQRFTCVNPQNGKSRWTTKPFGKYWSMVVNGTRILALDQTGELRLIEADSEAYQEIDARTLGSEETWAHLAVSDGQVFVRELNAMTTWAWK